MKREARPGKAFVRILQSQTKGRNSQNTKVLGSRTLKLPTVAIDDNLHSYERYLRLETGWKLNNKGLLRR